MVEHERNDEKFDVSEDDEEGVEDEGDEVIEPPNPRISLVTLRAFKRASLSIIPPPKSLSIPSDFFFMLTPQLNLTYYKSQGNYRIINMKAKAYDHDIVLCIHILPEKPN